RRAGPGRRAGHLPRGGQLDAGPVAARHPAAPGRGAPRPGAAGPGEGRTPSPPRGGGRGRGRPPPARRGGLCSPSRGRPSWAPRGGGALTALAACPDADVIFVAHAGLDLLVSVADVWRSLPMDTMIRAKWWRVPAGEVPRDADQDTQLRWLYDWWELIDAWITDNRPG